MEMTYPNTNLYQSRPSFPVQTYPALSAQARTTSPPDSWRFRFNRGIAQGGQSLKHHWLNILLMGASTLLFPLFPKPLKMSFKHALAMAPVHMALMGAINFSLGFIKSFRSSQTIEVTEKGCVEGSNE